MPNVLVTHADEPLGRRIVKLLWHDERVGRLFAVGAGPPPRAFERFRIGAPPRLHYERVDLARHRPVADLFRSKRLRDAAIDSVIHVPEHAARQNRPVVARVPGRTAEARLVLQHALESGSIGSLVALGSACVYRLAPGNANRLHESSELDLDPDVPPELRSWIDCDMLFHGEIGSARLRLVLLRVPTVVASGGYVYLRPGFEGRAGPRLRAAGFDPLCALISDKDVARAAQAALHAETPGVFNVAGHETVPLSVLGRWTRRPCVPVPGPLLGGLNRVAGRLGPGRFRDLLDGPHLRYGFTLDVREAERVLGFRPRYRVGLARAGDGLMRLEAVPA